MGKFSFVSVLDSRKILQAELAARFTELATKINTSFHDTEQLRRFAARYRHMKEPLRIFARSTKTGTAIFAGALTKVGAWNWTNCVVSHVQVTPTASNRSTTGQPVLYLHASYFAHDWEVGAYEIGIGYSTDNGATYTFWPYSNTHLGYTHARTTVPWTAGTTHYHTGAGGWWSRTMFGHREAHSTIAALSINGIDITTITDWAIGIRVNGTDSNGTGTKDVHELDVAKLILVSRDST